VSKIYVQSFEPVWQTSACLSGSGTSGSFVTAGYRHLLGMIMSCTSSVAGSGLSIYQSPDYGAHWDYVTACAISACSGSAFDIEIVGNAAKIEFRPDTTASIFRTLWQLRPI
jgi:hypothetical protein